MGTSANGVHTVKSLIGSKGSFVYNVALIRCRRRGLRTSSVYPSAGALAAIAGLDDTAAPTAVFHHDRLISFFIFGPRMRANASARAAGREWDEDAIGSRKFLRRARRLVHDNGCDDQYRNNLPTTFELFN